MRETLTLKIKMLTALTFLIYMLNGCSSGSNGGAVNIPPFAFADAGVLQNVKLGDTVTLDGSGSTDSDNHPLTYEWTITESPTGSQSTLSSTTAVKPIITPDLAGFYSFSLVVHDGSVSSETSKVTVLVNASNNAPAADIRGPTSVVLNQQAVKFDGSHSYDADGDSLSYQWDFVLKPTGSALTSSQLGTNALVTFTPDVEGQYIIGLLVSDGQGPLSLGIVSHKLTVSLPKTEAGHSNTAPVANAGNDEHGTVGNPVILDASKSTDSDGNNLTFSWHFVNKPVNSTVTIPTENPHPNPKVSSFPMQSVTFTPDVKGDYVVGLTVSDGEFSSSDNVHITVSTNNSVPVANAGVDQQNIAKGSTIHIDGGASYDNDNDALTYAWTLTKKPSGSSASIIENSATFDFNVDADGEYVWSLVVSDPVSSSVVDNMVIHVIDPVSVPNKATQLINIGVDQHDAAWLVSHHETEVDYVLAQTDRIFNAVPAILDSMFKLGTDPGAASFTYSTPTNWDAATKARFIKIMGRIIFAVNTEMFKNAFDSQVGLLDMSHQGNTTAAFFPSIPFPANYDQFKLDSNAATATDSQNYQFFIASDTAGVAYGIQGLKLIVEQDMMGLSIPGTSVKGWTVNGAAPLVFHELTHSFGYAHDPNTAETALKPNNIPYFVQIILGYTSKDILGTYCAGDPGCPKPNLTWGNPDSVLTVLFGEQ